MIFLLYLAFEQANGNIRYVNARFINKGKSDVRIFPDRGIRRKTGYGVSKKSSTLLEFVLKEGPLPYGMDFLVKRNDSDDVLSFHNKEWLHVDASDDIQVVVEIIIGDGKSAFEIMITVAEIYLNRLSGFKV